MTSLRASIPCPLVLMLLLAACAGDVLPSRSEPGDAGDSATPTPAPPTTSADAGRSFDAAVDTAEGVDANVAPVDADDPPPPPGRIPIRGSGETLDIGSWNLTWFGAPNAGPENDALQRENARDVIAGSHLDAWGLVEVVNEVDFSKLLEALPGYGGILANDPRVALGKDYYADSEQKPALLYRENVATLISAQLILTENDESFAGRPPLQARLSMRIAGREREVVVIVVHAKALNDASSWQKRLEAAQALKLYLDDSFAEEQVIVLGDFNDELLRSITKNRPSPYAAFLSDEDYGFPTEELAIAKIGTTVGRTSAIDHHLTTRVLFDRYVPTSVEAYRVDKIIEDYKSTTSDHYPVLSKYTW